PRCSGRELLAVVPDIGGELPFASDLFPHHDILAGNFLRFRTFGLEAEGPDLARRRSAEWLHVDGCKFRIGDLLRYVLPRGLDRGSALDHSRTWRECGRVVGVERGDTGKIVLVEALDPLGVHRLDLRLLCEGWDDQRGK